MARISLGEVVAARRSLTVGRLPLDVETRLLERPLRERQQLADPLARSRPPFGDVRAVLREVDAVLR